MRKASAPSISRFLKGKQFLRAEQLGPISWAPGFRVHAGMKRGRPMVTVFHRVSDAAKMDPERARNSIQEMLRLYAEALCEHYSVERHEHYLVVTTRES